MELDVDFGALVADLALPTLRMVDLARALAREPRLLLLDEITAALPSDLAERVFVAMRDAARARALRPLHLAPAQRGDPGVRPGHDPA